MADVEQRLHRRFESATSSLVCASDAMERVARLARRVAAGSAKVLITGESGVGKDVVARYIHEHSERAPRAYVAVNCAAFTETLLESELFGHMKGSFTDAHRDQIGKLQLAHEGTIFLDEIGEMSLRMQALLLRFLESGEIQPVGSQSLARHVDVRVITATNRDLEALVAAGQFRHDLLYRIKVVHIRIPPLRERRKDIRPLVEHILRRVGRPISFTDQALDMLERYRWPGNVRELQNVIEQLAWDLEEDLIDVRHLPPSLSTASEIRVAPVRERRRTVADDLYASLVAGHYSFWEHVYVLFLERDITRHDLRELVRKGLTATCGNYRAMLNMFHIPPADYKRFLNFLAAHKCSVDYRPFRTLQPDASHAARGQSAGKGTRPGDGDGSQAVAGHPFPIERPPVSVPGTRLPAPESIVPIGNGGTTRGRRPGPAGTKGQGPLPS